MWALAVLPTLFGARKLAALKAVQVGLYRWFTPDFENEKNNKNENERIKCTDQKKQQMLVTKWIGLLKSRAVHTAAVHTAAAQAASIKKNADECIRGMLHRWKVRKRVDRTQRRRCFNRLFYWAADKQYMTNLRKWSVETTEEEESIVGSTPDSANSIIMRAPELEFKPVVKRAINESGEPDSAAVCTLKACLKQQATQLYSEYRVACTFISLETVVDNSQAIWLAMVTGWDTPVSL